MAKPETRCTVLSVGRLEDGRLIRIAANYGTAAERGAFLRLPYQSHCYLCGALPWRAHNPGCATFTASPEWQCQRVTVPGMITAQGFKAFCREVHAAESSKAV